MGDNRTVAIWVVLALIVGVVVGLIIAVESDDDGANTVTRTAPAETDEEPRPREPERTVEEDTGGVEPGEDPGRGTGGAGSP
jgi:hypothetical protein